MTNSSQIEMISLEKLVPENHVYRKIQDFVNFSRMLRNLKYLMNCQAKRTTSYRKTCVIGSKKMHVVG